MGHNIDIESYISDLQRGHGQEKENAAVNIAKAAEDPENDLKRAVPALKDALYLEDTPTLRGKAASALAEIAYNQSVEVDGVEDRLIELLDEEGFNQLNAILGVAALGIYDAKDKLDQISNGQKPRAAAILSSHVISSNFDTTPDYLHVKTVVTDGIQILGEQVKSEEVTQPAEDHAAVAIILKNRDSDALGKVLVEAAQNNPEYLHDIIPILEESLTSGVDRSDQYILWTLREYAKEYPERVVHLVDDVAAYLSPSHSNMDPGNPTGFLEEIAKNEPQEVIKYQERIRQLRDHENDYVREHCRSILSHIDEVNNGSFKVTSSINNSHQVETHPMAKSNSNGDTKLDDLRERAVENAVDLVPEAITTTSNQTQQYTRSSEVREYVLARADGVCEGCGAPAPFTSKTGEPYLHAHHIHELSDGGSDTPDTVVALCPNCHYRVHHGEDGGEYNADLLRIVQRIESG